MVGLSSIEAQHWKNQPSSITLQTKFPIFIPWLNAKMECQVSGQMTASQVCSHLQSHQHFEDGDSITTLHPAKTTE